MAKKLKRCAPTERYLQQGEEAAMRLGLLKECAGLVGPVVAATALVRSSLDKRRAAARALIPIRVKCSFADWDWDGTLRAMSASVESQTGGRKSAAWREIFPESLTPLVTPQGEGQRAAAERFLGHLTTCTLPAAQAAVEEWKPKLQKAYDTLAAALAERRTAEAALFVARGEEQAAKRDFNRTIEKTIALVKSIYPEDRARLDLAFPSLDDDRAVEEDEEPEAEPAPEAQAD
jgi:hypothetical protein